MSSITGKASGALGGLTSAGNNALGSLTSGLSGSISGSLGSLTSGLGSLSGGLSGLSGGLGGLSGLTSSLGGLGGGLGGLSNLAGGIGSKIGSVLSGAGGSMLSGFANSLSQWSGNLKAGIIRDSIGSSSNKEFKVSLADGLGNRVVFDSSPTIEESRQVQWDSYQITHLPANLITFKSTGSRTLSINVKLVSRTSLEAAENYKRMKLIRYWSVPSFGIYGDGSPPNILTLNGFTTHFKNIQVVLNSYSWSFPEDVDWIHTGSEPFPTVITISLSMQETFSPEQLVFFDKGDINDELGGVKKWAQVLSAAASAQATTSSLSLDQMIPANINADIVDQAPNLDALTSATSAASPLDGLSSAASGAAEAAGSPLANLTGAEAALSATGLNSATGVIGSVSNPATGSLSSLYGISSNAVNTSLNQVQNSIGGASTVTNMVANTQQANNTGLRGDDTSFI
jgi:hypothetical protein